MQRTTFHYAPARLNLSRGGESCDGDKHNRSSLHDRHDAHPGDAPIAALLLAWAYAQYGSRSALLGRTVADTALVPRR